ncbi:glycosyltransferase family 2 protein [Aquisalimonas asiatica]|uniref:Glycosyltransferase, catalytic subunit of cellulose synthase and poly-beta-1,6-N-acetylglucosamine synthase n=1 Tax=Aquisalimonas asiatica TaxID=406100 RepID=A0A1H8PSN1_9GAMM|nr:glycosyltransferase [Aquisalimonas asiatica]SEO44553.1 Glycosyltransferase, catalytic subunit of cellulose synthase and poly-beta-1,6-N-acetylglucosamine synthase [Aquisalimonas asiatica]
MTGDILVIAQLVFLAYFIGLNGGYLTLNLLALASLRRSLRYRTDGETGVPYLGIEPGTSLLVPAYNEETTIVASIRSMLQLEYPDFEIIVINDGSRDETLDALKRAFDLQPQLDPALRVVPCAPVRGVFRSRNHPELTVVDKANGGKADALNAGLNYASKPLFCAVDADSILQRDSLLRVVQPFMDDERTIAAGGTVRVANGSDVQGGFLVSAGLPRSLLARLQIVEYLRAFLFGRLGWSPLNALLIISGAFGLFDRDRVIAAGGYRTDCVGEDMELVVRLHQYHRERRIPYRIRYVPDPICWTEVPEDMGTLHRQRTRWQRGLAESLTSNWRLAANPRGGMPGRVAWPFMAIFEWLGPLIELAGYLFMVTGFAMGFVSGPALLAFMLVAVGFGMVLSVTALLLEALSFRVYTRRTDMLRLFLAALVENLGYRQLNTLWRCQGLWQWLRGKRHEWGEMRRVGTWSS